MTRSCIAQGQCLSVTVIAGAAARARVEANAGAEWLHGYLEKLDGLAGRMESGDSDPDYGYHTALKVVAMGYYAKPFSKIAGAQIKQERCGGAVLVDLFAGSGLVRIRDSESLSVRGSVSYAASMTADVYDKVASLEPVAQHLEGASVYLQPLGVDQRQDHWTLDVGIDPIGHIAYLFVAVAADHFDAGIGRYLA